MAQSQQRPFSRRPTVDEWIRFGVSVLVPSFVFPLKLKETSKQFLLTLMSAWLTARTSVQQKTCATSSQRGTLPEKGDDEKRPWITWKPAAEMKLVFSYWFTDVMSSQDTGLEYERRSQFFIMTRQMAPLN